MTNLEFIRLSFDYHDELYYRTTFGFGHLVSYDEDYEFEGGSKFSPPSTEDDHVMPDIPKKEYVNFIRHQCLDTDGKLYVLANVGYNYQNPFKYHQGATFLGKLFGKAAKYVGWSCIQNREYWFEVKDKEAVNESLIAIDAVYSNYKGGFKPRFISTEETRAAHRKMRAELKASIKKAEAEGYYDD
jgi:hypothetical protein